MTCIGPKALTIHNGLPFQSEDEKKNLAKILELWESYCLGKTNIIYERYRFINRHLRIKFEISLRYVQLWSA